MLKIKFRIIILCQPDILQKSIETLGQYWDKLKEYSQKLYVCGERTQRQQVPVCI